MNKKRSLDDTCDIFLSRRHIRSPLNSQRTASELPQRAPTLRAQSIGVPPYFLFPRPLEIPELPATRSTPTSPTPLPLPGSSGPVQAKPMRLTNGHRHIPRPRNPFILFRCDFVHQRKILPRSGLDDTNISRIAGDLWREMTAAQKKPWMELAAQEKARHALLYPDYKYAPANCGSKSKKRTKKSNTSVEDRARNQAFRKGAASTPDYPQPRRQPEPERPRPYPQAIPRRRSSSCPPTGAVPVPSHPSLEGWSPTSSQDDMRRSPSRTVMYHSATPQSVAEPAASMPAGYNYLLPPQGPEWLNVPQTDPLLLDSTYAFSDLNQSPDTYATSNYGFVNYEPTFPYGTDDCGYTLYDLKDIECPAVDPMFTDPFSTLASLPVDNNYPWTFSTAIPPFDCSGLSAVSPSRALPSN